MFSSVVILQCGLFGVILQIYSYSFLYRDIGVSQGFVLAFSSPCTLGRRKLQLFENVDFGVKLVFEPWHCYFTSFLTWANHLTSFMSLK